MRVEPLRSSTEGVANIEKGGNEVLTGGDEVRGDDALTLQSTATFCNKSSMIVSIFMIPESLVVSIFCHFMRGSRSLYHS
jgi:hypothetical protein